MNKHTLGPWQHSAKLSASENHRGFSIWDSNGWALADVQPADEDGKEGRANACLIAAAPDLLEALKLLVRPHGGTVATSADHELAIKARSAIAKAIGEES